MSTAFGPQGPNHTTTLPAIDSTVEPGDTWCQDCTNAATPDGTIPTASFLNVLIGNLRTAVRNSGVALVDGDMTLLYQAIQALANAAAAGVQTGLDALTARVDIAETNITALQAASVTVANLGSGAQVSAGRTGAGPYVDTFRSLTDGLGTQFVQGAVDITAISTLPLLSELTALNITPAGPPINAYIDGTGQLLVWSEATSSYVTLTGSGTGSPPPVTPPPVTPPPVTPPPPPVHGPSM